MTEFIVSPTVNLNGTSKRELLEQCLRAIEALDRAQEALIQMTPHGRDYQTAQNGDYETARKQARDRHERVLSVRREIEVIACRIDL